MLELDRDASGVALQPEQHPGQDANREQHSEAFERFKDSAIELAGRDLEPSTHRQREGRRRRNSEPDLAKVALLVNPPQVAEKDSDDQRDLDAFTGGDQQRK